MHFDGDKSPVRVTFTYRCKSNQKPRSELKSQGSLVHFLARNKNAERPVNNYADVCFRISLLLNSPKKPNTALAFSFYAVNCVATAAELPAIKQENRWLAKKMYRIISEDQAK